MHIHTPIYVHKYINALICVCLCVCARVYTCVRVYAWIRVESIIVIFMFGRFWHAFLLAKMHVFKINFEERAYTLGTIDALLLYANTLFFCTQIRCSSLHKYSVLLYTNTLFFSTQIFCSSLRRYSVHKYAVLLCAKTLFFSTRILWSSLHNRHRILWSSLHNSEELPYLDGTMRACTCSRGATTRT